MSTMFMLFQEAFVFQQPINISIICSVARKPELKEWTARTKVFDTLHDPVG